MNIVFIFRMLFNPTTGGIERVTDLLCRELLRRGHHVEYLNNIAEGEYAVDGYDYPAPVHLFPLQRGNKEPEHTENIAFYSNFLSTHNIDIAIIQDAQYFKPLLEQATIPDKVRTITVLHSNPLFNLKHIYRSVLLNCDNWEYVKRLPWELKWAHDKRVKLSRQLAASYDKAITHSEAFCLLSSKFIPELLTLCPSCDIDKVVTIANPNTYPPQPHIDWEGKRNQILYVGRLDKHQKRVDRVIKVWKRLYRKFSDWELVIVGDGPQADELKRMASSLERVTFTGWQNPEPYYRSSSLLCLTSDYEGWGMVLTEAMTFGTVPVLFNSYNAAGEVVQNGISGILVKPFSLSQMAHELQQLMSDNHRRRQMAIAATQQARQFDIAVIADRWEKLFEKLKSK